MIRNVEAFTSANKDAFDAWLQFGKIITSGVQDMQKQIMALTQTAIEMNVETSKALMGIRSLDQLADVQTNWLTQSVNNAMTGSAKLSQLSSKISSEAAEPLKSHFSIVCKTGNGVAPIFTKVA